MQWQLKTFWSPEDDPPDLPVELTQEIREDLSWWTVESRFLQGVPFGTLPPGLLLFTDASCAGWGVHLLDQRASGKWSEEEKMLHINLLEMKAVWLGLQSFQKIVTGHRVTVMCNNSTVVAYVSKPFALLGKVLSRVRQSRNCSMTVSSPLGRQGLVRGSTAPADASTSRSASVGRRHSPAPQRSTPPRRPRVETSCVATVKQLLRKSGFSRGAASDMSRCVRESTSNVYQSKWLAFCNWCRERGVAPVNASVPLIVDFFRHLVRDKGLSVPAVRSYRASLNSVFALKGRDLAAS